MKFIITKEIKDKFPETDFVLLPMHGVKVAKKTGIISAKVFDDAIAAEKEADFLQKPELVAFRDFFERLGIDSDVHAPSVENLYKRYFAEGTVPHVNNIVDAQNVASLQTLIPMGVFDLDTIAGDISLRFSSEGEEFRPLDGSVEHLPAGLPVIADEEKILSRVYVDSIYQKITKDTKNVLIVADKVAGIAIEQTETAALQVAENIKKVAGGKRGKMFRTVTQALDRVQVVSSARKKEGEKVRVFSGTRATGRLHLGNYLGAVKGYIALQEKKDYECVYMAVDMHTITTPYDPENLKDATRNIIMDYLAAGLDPNKAVVTVQSLVPEHVLLAYLFSSVVSIARMRHLPTFKEKIKQHPYNVTMALLNYPILMAADILVYKASFVPVGIDQEPHLEITREIARKMNMTFGTNFPEPRRFATKGEYVPSLKGEGKMSKSVEGSYINLSDSFEAIKKKLAGAPTDSGKGAKVPASGGVANLLKLVELFEGEAQRKIYEDQYKSTGIRYGDLKKQLAGTIYEELKPIQARRKELEANLDEVDRIISEGAEKARGIAGQILRETQKKMGIFVG